MSGLQPFDFFVIITLGFMAFWGGCRGLFSQVMSIASLLVSWYGSSRYYSILSSFVPLSEPWKDTVAMLLLFFIMMMGCRLVTKFIGGVFIKKTVLKEFDRQMGALVGLLKGFIITLVVTFFAVMGNDQTQKLVTDAPSGRFMVRVLSTVQQYIPENENHAKIRAAFEKFSNATSEEGISTEPLQVDPSETGHSLDSIRNTVVGWFHSAKTGTGSDGATKMAANIPTATDTTASDPSTLKTDAFAGLIDEFESFFGKNSNGATSAAEPSTGVTELTGMTGLTGSVGTGAAPNTLESASASDASASSGSILDRQTFAPYSTAPPF